MTVVRACHDSHDRRRFDVSKVGSVESRAPVGAETQHRFHTSLVVSRNQVSRLDLPNALRRDYGPTCCVYATTVPRLG